MSYDPSSIPRRRWETNSFSLESGKTIHDFHLTYIVHGEPEHDGSNVVLVTSSLGGNAHRLDFMIGDNLAFDPTELCIIAVDAIGNGYSISPSNSRQQARMSFPSYLVRDMVEAQKQLLNEVFDLNSVLMVAGASMGGMQALQWGVSYPNAMQGIVSLVPMAKSQPWSVVVNETSRRILMADPAWNDGNYSSSDFDGWKASLAFTQGIAARSPELVKFECGDNDPCLWLDALVDQGLVGGFDPNDWIFQSRAYDQHDVGTTNGFNGNTRAALSSISAPTLVMGPSLDLLNPSEEQIETAQSIPAARYVSIPSSRGHLAANIGDVDDIALINKETEKFVTQLRLQQRT